MEQPKLFSKICGAGKGRKSRRGCGAPFTSAVRHEKFCLNCKVPAKVKARQNRKRREEYRKEQTRFRAETRSRAAARRALIAETLAQCAMCRESGIPSSYSSAHWHPIAQLECDHIDNNPMNNAPSNRQWLCEPHHKSKTRKDSAVKVANAQPQ